MMYLDLDELDEVLNQSCLWSRSAFSPARFKRSDYLGESSENLKQLVLDKVEESTGKRPSGSVCMLSNCRYFGFVINPLTLYYCFDQQGCLQAMLLEVTNTPWKQRHQYVLECNPETQPQRISFDKQMHVSPFHPMNMRYHMNSYIGGVKLSVHLQNVSLGDPQTTVFDASLNLQREEISSGALAKVILSYPLMTVKVVAAIYWQALKLFLKRVPLHPYARNAT